MLNDPEILVTNLLGDIENIEEFEDRNCIKVVCDQQSNAIYFSREPIPTRSKGDNVSMKKQVCIIPFTRAFLLKYTELPTTPLEITESIDMMRVLEYGMKVRMIPTKHQTHAVDTVEDLNKVEKLMKG
jgi:3-deoxy-manno-octulosonate cytidylyltransferase (CMP-KDO synthetase)